MSLTRAEEKLISMLKNEGVKEQPEGDFYAKLLVAVASGSQPDKEDDRIRWGGADLTKEFKNYDDKTKQYTWVQALATNTIVELCKALLDQRNTFEQGPLRQVHVISKLYGELLERSVADKAVLNDVFPDYLHKLNIKMLKQYIMLDQNNNFDAAVAALKSCISNFIFMSCTANATPKMVQSMMSAQETLQKVFDADIERVVKENKTQFVEMILEMKEERRLKEIAREFKGSEKLPSTPILRRKLMAEQGNQIVNEGEAPKVDPKKREMLQVHSTMSKASVSLPTEKMAETVAEPQKEKEQKQKPVPSQQIPTDSPLIRGLREHSVTKQWAQDSTKSKSPGKSQSDPGPEGSKPQQGGGRPPRKGSSGHG